MSSASDGAPADDTALGRAIAKVDDPALRAVLSREVARLKDSRRFGLVFDRHLPESARLPTHPVRAGLTVVRRDDPADEVRLVTAIDGSVATLDDDTTADVATLVVFRDFGDVVHPALRSVERIGRGAETEPWHTVIQGENLHVLQMLRQTHRGLMDLIYIDPPYNTGNDGWIYDDRYVDANDRARSSKWLSFMERRLIIARSLLKPTGVIIVAIGDDEHHRLRMLMDQIFGASNFISDVVWQGGRKNDSRYVSNGADYMLIYARDADALSNDGQRWRDQKVGVFEVLEKGARAWLDANGNADLATEAMRAWFRSTPKDDPVRALSRNVYFLPDGRLCRDDNITWPGGGGPKYDVLHPITLQPVPVPERGWIFAAPEKMEAAIEAGRVIFRADHSKPISIKLPLEDNLGQVALSVFDRQRTHAGRHLATILSEKRFPFPKDHEVLMRWIRLAAPDDALILDFFGGSGTTTEAVIRLNAEDGGSRQSILVTNNEVGPKKAKEMRKAGLAPGDPEWESFGVFDYVTRPRVSTVVTGTRPDGTIYSDGLKANVELFELGYLDPADIRLGREFAAIAPILWMEAGAAGPRIDGEPEQGWAVADTYGVLFDMDALKPFAAEVTARAMADAPVSIAYVVTDSPTEARIVGERLPAGCRVKRLYESHIDRFALAVDGEDRE